MLAVQQDQLALLALLVHQLLAQQEPQAQQGLLVSQDPQDQALLDPLDRQAAKVPQDLLEPLGQVLLDQQEPQGQLARQAAKVLLDPLERQGQLAPRAVKV